MIIPSVDIRNGRAVQLRQGREFVLDGGDPLDRVAEFAVAGEVAVIDLDAAMGIGSNQSIVLEAVRRYPCRVGGGIRDARTARRWLDAGARHIIVGTAATPDFLAQFPRERLIAAVDARSGSVVVEGWTATTGASVADAIQTLAPYVSGFLLTQVEHEGEMAGFSLSLIEQAQQVAGSARLTAAGGITTAAEIAQLDRLGVDAQVGMAIYSGRLSLADAITAPLTKPIDEDRWPTVVCDESGDALGLVWSTKESIAAAVAEQKGIYWSRSRQELWRKGATSGDTQDLVRIDLDCDRDALRFVVRQHGTGFCHTGRPACWPRSFTLSDLERTLRGRIAEGDPASGTVKLAHDPALRANKLREEAIELGRAESPADIVHEAADVIYFTLATLAAHGIPLQAVREELARRQLRTTRRSMRTKDEAGDH